MLNPEQEAFALQFLKQHEAAIFSTIRKYAPSVPGYDEDDLAQELKEEFVRQFHKFDPSRAILFTWAMWLWKSKCSRIVRQELKTHKRVTVDKEDQETKKLLRQIVRGKKQVPEHVLQELAFAGLVDWNSGQLTEAGQALVKEPVKTLGTQLVEFNDELDIVMLDDTMTNNLVFGLEEAGLSAQERGIITLITAGMKPGEIQELRGVADEEWNEIMSSLQMKLAHLAPEGFRFSREQMKGMALDQKGKQKSIAR